MRGQDIERLSLRMIRSILPSYALPEAYTFLFERIVHATADFSLLPLLVLKEGFIECFFESLTPGYTIFCDVAMVQSGVNEKLLKKSGVQLVTFVHTKACDQRSRKHRLTRAAASVDFACEQGIRGFVFGNSPTGLGRLLEWIARGYRVDWVLACPVGFVGAAEVKEELLRLPVPALVLRGPRGGSPIAAAALNALLREFLRRRNHA